MEVFKSNLKSTDNKFNDARKYFLDSYPGTINMFLMGNWYKSFNVDAQIVATIMDYKLFADNYSPYLGNICCGFPKESLSKVLNKLKEFKINYNIINTNDWSYEFYNWKTANNYDEFVNNDGKILKKEEKPKIIDKENTYAYIKVGDSVEIVNITTKEKEIYTILPAYYKFTPKSVSKNFRTFGMIEYKKELNYDYDVEKGEISSESSFAKKLLKHKEKDIFEWIDEDEKHCKYLINRVVNKE